MERSSVIAGPLWRGAVPLMQKHPERRA